VVTTTTANRAGSVRGLAARIIPSLGATDYVKFSTFRMKYLSLFHAGAPHPAKTAGTLAKPGRFP
jgi:hypothetical protein